VAALALRYTIATLRAARKRGDREYAHPAALALCCIITALPPSKEKRWAAGQSTALALCCIITALPPAKEKQWAAGQSTALFLRFTIATLRAARRRGDRKYTNPPGP